MGTVLKYVILSAAKDLLFYGGESRSFALLRMTMIKVLSMNPTGIVTFNMSS